MLDTASGSIHCVDEFAYDAICMYGSAGGGKTAKFLLEKYGDVLAESEVSELISEIEDLICNGMLFSNDIISKTTLPGHPGGSDSRAGEHAFRCFGQFRDKTGIPSTSKTTLPGYPGSSDAYAGEHDPYCKALCLNVSHVCNMTCSYCFAGRGEYGSGGELMPLETGKRAVDFLIENSGDLKNLDIDFFGGEPLLNWGVVKGIVDHARRMEQRSGKRFRFTLTTNGLLIDDDVIDFANREMHNVVLSLDGRPWVNDAARKLPDGRGSYSEILPKIKKLVEARGGKNYYIRGTFTRDNLDFSEDILHMAGLGFTELSMEPAVAAPDDAFRLAEDDLPEIGGQYERLAMEMLKRRGEGRAFTFYHYKLDLKSGPCIYKRIAGCGAGTGYLAVTPSGELYPCHQFVGDKNFLMGDIWRGVENEKLHSEFNGCNMYSRAECIECWARMYCSGGCAANAYRDSGSINGVYRLGCEMFKKRMECAIMMKAAEALTHN